MIEVRGERKAFNKVTDNTVARAPKIDIQPVFKEEPPQHPKKDQDWLEWHKLLKEMVKYSGKSINRKYFPGKLDQRTMKFLPRREFKTHGRITAYTVNQNMIAAGDLNGCCFSSDATNVLMWHCDHNLKQSNMGFKLIR